MSIDQDKIDWFRASTSYINLHRNKIFVVLLSGEAIADSNLPNIVYDLTLLRSLGVKLVLVHGARPQISAALQAAGLDSEYHNSLRITPAGCMDVVNQTVGALSIQLESLFSMGMYNSPMQGANVRLCRGNFVTAKPVGVRDGTDFQYTGLVRRVHTTAIEQQLAAGNIVMLSNLGYSLSGEVFNLSAEAVATETAIALKADKLILMIPAGGLTDSEGRLLSALDQAGAEARLAEMQDDGEPDSRCLRQALGAAIEAHRHGVHRSHLISYRQDGALLQELFTREGNGSLISSDSFDQLRAARIEDVAAILALIKPLEEDGTLVERSRELLETEIDNFTVIELEGAIVACAALYPIGEGCGEIACIAIDPHYRNLGFGKRLLQSLEQGAAGSGMEDLFVLTTVASHWFQDNGFAEVGREQLPDQRQQLYNLQRKSKVLHKKLG